MTIPGFVLVSRLRAAAGPQKGNFDFGLVTWNLLQIQLSSFYLETEDLGQVIMHFMFSLISLIFIISCKILWNFEWIAIYTNAKPSSRHYIYQFTWLYCDSSESKITRGDIWRTLYDTWLSWYYATAILIAVQTFNTNHSIADKLAQTKLVKLQIDSFAVVAVVLYLTSISICSSIFNTWNIGKHYLVHTIWLTNKALHCISPAWHLEPFPGYEFPYRII